MPRNKTGYANRSHQSLFFVKWRLCTRTYAGFSLCVHSSLRSGSSLITCRDAAAAPPLGQPACCEAIFFSATHNKRGYYDVNAEIAQLLCYSAARATVFFCYKKKEKRKTAHKTGSSVCFVFYENRK